MLTRSCLFIRFFLFSVCFIVLQCGRATYGEVPGPPAQKRGPSVTSIKHKTIAKGAGAAADIPDLLAYANYLAYIYHRGKYFTKFPSLCGG